MKLLIRDGGRGDGLPPWTPRAASRPPNSILIRHPDLVRPLLEMFEKTWKAAVKVETYQRRAAATGR